MIEFHFLVLLSYSILFFRAAEALIFFNALISALLTHPDSLRGRVGGKLPQAQRHLGAAPVEYRKLETHFKRIINNN